MNDFLTRVVDGYRELKRRHVIRVAAGYAVAAWVAVQVAAIVFPALTLPRWTVTAAVVAALAGFPVAVLLAWIIEPVSDAPASDAERAESPPRYRVGHPVALLFSLVGLVALVGWWVWQGRPLELSAFPARGQVVLADFRTEATDGLGAALTGGLELSLEQSPHVNLIPRGRIQDALRRMRRSPDADLDAGTAREVALREGADLVLAPRAAGLGGSFRLGVRILEPESGEVLRTVTSRVDGRDRLLDGVDRLAEELRGVLGESKLSVLRRSEPLERVTTSSLQALEQYSLGRRAHVRNDFDRARRLYENAVREDSTFITALAALGMLEYERFDRQRGTELLRRAVDHVDAIGDRERYGVLTAHAIAVEGDLEKAHGHQKALADLYPGSYVAHNNLGRISQLLGRHREAVSAYQRALDIYPGLGIASSGLFYVLAFEFDRVDSALVVARGAVAADSTDVRARMQLGMALLAMDSVDVAGEHFRRAVDLAPGSVTNRIRLAHLHRLAGRHRAARDVLAGILEEDSTVHEARYDLGAVLQAAGRTREAGKHLRRNLDHWRERTGGSEGARPLYYRAALLVRLGEVDGARRMLDEAVGVDSTLFFERARLRALLGEEDGAVRLLRRSVSNGFGDFFRLKLHPDFSRLRDRPEFRELLQEGFFGGGPLPEEDDRGREVRSGGEGDAAEVSAPGP